MPGQKRQIAKYFVRHRICLPIVLVWLEGLIILNTFTTGVWWDWITIFISITAHLLLFYTAFALRYHYMWAFRGLQLYHLKTTKLPRLQLVLILIYFLIVMTLFGARHNFIPADWNDNWRIANFYFIRATFVYFMLALIPVIYHGFLAWNAERLQFSGLHPETKRQWEGYMKKNKNGNWEVDQGPEEHELMKV